MQPSTLAYDLFQRMTWQLLEGLPLAICQYILNLYQSFLDLIVLRWVNTGHGSKGWTYCWGSSTLLAQLITGQVAIYIQISMPRARTLCQLKCLRSPV